MLQLCMCEHPVNEPDQEKVDLASAIVQEEDGSLEISQIIPELGQELDQAKVSEEPLRYLDIEPSVWDVDLSREGGLPLGVLFQSYHPKRMMIMEVRDGKTAAGLYNDLAPEERAIQAKDIILAVNGVTGTENIREIMSGDEKELRLRIGRPRQLDFTISRGIGDAESKQPWGINVEWISTNGGLVVQGITEDGAVDRHNRAQASWDTKVLVGDTIEAVNDQSSRVGAEMTGQLKLGLRDLRVTVARVVAPYTLYYLGACQTFVARAFSPLCILEAAGAVYEIKDKDVLPKSAGPFAVPAVTLPDGSTIGQTTGLCMSLGSALGLAPSGRAARRRALQLMDDISDFQTETFEKKGKDRLMKWMSHFDKALGSKPFFMGDKCTCVDYAAMGQFMLCHLKEEHKSPDFEGVSWTAALRGWLGRMKADPAVQRVMALGPFFEALPYV